MRNNLKNCPDSKWKRGFEKQLKERLVELKKESEVTRTQLSEFYHRLPCIEDPKIVITELQGHIDALIDLIIHSHEFVDKEVLGE